MRFLIKEIKAQKRDEKLSVKDRKLLQLLIQNGRAPVSDLARRVGISKPAIVQKMRALEEKEILLYPVTYTHSEVGRNTKFHILQIATDLGMDNKKITSELLNMDEIAAVLWYNGNFNLLIGVFGDPQVALETIEDILTIKKIRISKVIGNWFHPPHLFKEIPDVKVKFERREFKVDALDEKILLALENSPRATIVQIGEQVKSSVLTVKKRVSELKTNGAIVRFSYYVHPWICGRDVISISFVIRGRKNTDNLISKILSLPQSGNIWEFDHEWNINAVFWVHEPYEVNEILDKLYRECAGILETEISVLNKMVGK